VQDVFRRHRRRGHGRLFITDGLGRRPAENRVFPSLDDGVGFRLGAARPQGRCGQTLVGRRRDIRLDGRLDGRHVAFPVNPFQFDVVGGGRRRRPGLETGRCRRLPGLPLDMFPTAVQFLLEHGRDFPLGDHFALLEQA